MPPSVSVLITAYEAENDIAAALRSALHQSVSDIEVVVVDDASTDGTARIVQHHARQDPRVRLLSLRSNRGPGGGRNAGLALCRGEWVALLDSDDAFEPGRLEAMLARADEVRADMVADNLRLVSYPGREPLGIALGPDELPSDGWIDLHSYIRSNLFLPGRYNFGYLKPMMRRSLILEKGLRFHEDLPICEDFHFYLDGLLAGAKWHMMAEPLYLYAVRPGSVSRAKSIAKLHKALVRNDRQMIDPRLDETARQLMGQRHDNIERAAAYLALLEDLRRFEVTAATRRALLRPGLLRMMAEALWRRGTGLLAAHRSG